MNKIGFMLIALLATGLSGCADQASLGIIGGADGPTQVIVTAAPGWWIPPCVIALAVIALVLWIVRRRRK